MKYEDWYVTQDQKYILVTASGSKYIDDPKGGKRKVVAIEGDDRTYLILVKGVDRDE